MTAPKIRHGIARADTEQQRFEHPALSDGPARPITMPMWLTLLLVAAEPEQAAARSAQRQPHAECMPTKSDKLGEPAIDTDHADRQRHGGQKSPSAICARVPTRARPNGVDESRPEFTISAGSSIGGLRLLKVRKLGDRGNPVC